MSFLHGLENSALTEWFLTSMWGFPSFIALHSVGMAFVVGLSLIVALRHFGFIAELSIATVHALIKIAWLGFALNVVTGVFLLSSRISEYLFDLTFLIKMGFVGAAAIGLRRMQRDFVAFAESATPLRPSATPALTLFCWIAAISAGRWIAYLSGMYG